MKEGGREGVGRGDRKMAIWCTLVSFRGILPQELHMFIPVHWHFFEGRHIEHPKGHIYMCLCEEQSVLMVAYIRGYIGNKMLVGDGVLEKEADISSWSLGERTIRS